jgi:hypothetical protein
VRGKSPSAILIRSVERDQLNTFINVSKNSITIAITSNNKISREIDSVLK